MTGGQALITRQRAAQAPFRHPLATPAGKLDQPEKTIPALLPAVEVYQDQTITQDRNIKQNQSLEFVQTLIAACVGSISYLRSFFPDDCFVKTRYGEARSATDYNLFSQEKATAETPGATRKGTKVTRLTRGVLPQVDSLLDWLEKGVFRALKDGYLKALQLAVYLDELQPQVVTESYTFSISYNDGIQTAELHITDQEGTKVTVTEADKSAQQLMRRLLVITEGLKPLPDRRWLTMRMHYREHTPKDYDPPGFKRLHAGSPGYVIPEEENEPVIRQSCGVMISGYHSVSLKVMSAGKHIPSTVRRGRRTVARFCAVDIDIDAPHFDFRPTPLTNSVKNGHERRPSKEPDDLSATVVENTQATLLSEGEVRERYALKGLYEKARPQDGLPPTQLLKRTPAPSNSLKRPRTEDVDDITRSRNRKQLKPTTAASVNRVEQQLVMKPETLAAVGIESPRCTRKRRRHHETTQIISCECGYHEEDGGMICCDICDHWQHAHCYGFFSEKDQRISDTHCCYSCLLGHLERPLLAEMTELAVYRRALRYLWENGKFPSTMDGFASEVGCTSDKVPAILSRLEEDGFAKSTSKPPAERQRPHAKLPKNIEMDVVKSLSNRAVLEEQHFNPRWKVAHHYIGLNDGQSEDTATTGTDTPDTQIFHSEKPIGLTGPPSSVSETPPRAEMMGAAADETKEQLSGVRTILDGSLAIKSTGFMPVSEVVNRIYVGK